MNNAPAGFNPAGPHEEDATMTNSKRRTKDDVVLVAVNMNHHTMQALPVEEIVRAIALHVEGKYFTCRHRYASETQRQQVRLATTHETQDGKRFRIVTEYDESFTFVELVEKVEAADVTTAH
jgi:hypothetical protein